MQGYVRLLEINNEKSEAAGDDEAADTEEPDGTTESGTSALEAELWIEAWNVVNEAKYKSRGTPVISVHAANKINVSVNKIIKIVRKHLNADTVYLVARSISSQIIECLWSILIQFTQGKRLCEVECNDREPWLASDTGSTIGCIGIA